MGKPIVILATFLFCLFGQTNTLFSQRSDHISDQFILWAEDADALAGILSDYTLINGQPSGLSIVRNLIPGFPIFLLEKSQENLEDDLVLHLLKTDPRVEHAQFNHYVHPRSVTPDDPLFEEQWNFLNPGLPAGNADIDLDLAWDITTGGETFNGHPIVVAVIDDGIDPYHPDLAPNLWYNTAEIPFNGEDDDQNGYTDDYAGWNVSAGFDLVQYGVHGVEVAGILGAKGDNGIGISGVNWDVRIMPIVGISGIESEVVEAYGYALNQRLLFQQTNGAEGALVSCTNSSFGVDYGDPQDFPIWCALFDLLGQNGILSVAATINADVDVDVEGDIPTACSSPYLITVTATDIADQRNFSGYGLTSIDLAAPGEDVLTTAVDNAYELVSGTSFASPHVAGLVALMYALPCNNLCMLIQEQPASAALQIRDAILNGVDSVSNLNGYLVTGGRLNAFKAMQNLLPLCDICLPPTGLQVLVTTDSSALLSWVESPDTEQSILQWRNIDSLNWNNVIEPEIPFQLTGLAPCSKYEFRMKSSCEDINSGFSASTSFTTLSCCESPSGITQLQIDSQTVLLSWQEDPGTEFYLLKYRETGDLDWITVPTTETLSLLEDLTVCGTYEVQIIGQCGPEQYSNPAGLAFTLTGCNDCMELPYCSVDFYASLEWIESFSINGQTYQSGNNGGYLEPAGSDLEFNAGCTIEFSIEPGFNGWTYYESYLIWIDLDQDGFFSEPEELLYQSPEATNETLIDTFVLPISATLGNTRMRVMQIYTGPYGLIFPFACTNFGEYGEVEDYCISILEPVVTTPPCDTNTSLEVVSVTSTEAQFSWQTPGPYPDHLLRYKLITDTIWNQVLVIDTSLQLTELDSCQTYEIQIADWCGSDWSPYSESVLFDMDCLTTGTVQATTEHSVRISPNPCREEVLFSGEPHQEYLLQLFSMEGRTIQNRTRQSNAAGLIRIDLSDLEQRGPLILKWQTADSSGAFRLIRL